MEESMNERPLDELESNSQDNDTERGEARIHMRPLQAGEKLVGLEFPIGGSYRTWVRKDSKKEN